MPVFAENTNKKYLLADYHQKKLENPFFKKKNRIVSWAGLKTKLLLAASVLILIVLFWFLFISSFWKIKEISITGLDQMTDTYIRAMIAEQMRAKNFLVLPQNNLLFFKADKFQEALKGRYRFQRIVIEKRWPDKLSIAITEKPIAVVWNEGDKYYYVDTDGFVVQEINPLDLADKQYPLVANESGERIYDSRIHADLGYLAAADYLYGKMATGSQGIIIDRFVVDNEIGTIKIQTPEGLKISFDTTGDLVAQLDRLYVLKMQKLKNDFFSKKKIDLRFGDKIYYQ